MNTDKTLDANYWDNRWKTDESAWDLGQPSPPLKDYIDTLSNKDLKILIPGCGNAYEAEYLVSKGFTNVTLIDIAETLVNKLKQNPALKSIRILNGDFFNHDEQYDLMLEQTFFCAINPNMRGQYVAHAYNILNENGKIAGLLFDTIFEKDGPPFGGSKEEYRNLFQSKFELKKFEACTNSIEPRQGNEMFVEMIKKELPDKL
jgi:methyl halide transferase